jgi:hypothetical protein
MAAGYEGQFAKDLNTWRIPKDLPAIRRLDACGGPILGQ